MSDRPRDDWPPIISGVKQTAWIRWRGVAITAFMWGLFVFILEREIELAWRAVSRLSGTPGEALDLDLEPFFADLRPTALIIFFLVAVLGVATLASRRRRRAGLRQAPPTPVPDSELADDLGLSERELNDIRRRTIVALDVDEQGRVSMRADWKSSARGAGD